MKNRTVFMKKEEVQGKRKWFILDASDKILGRFASEIVKILRGKHKVGFTPNVDVGDGVIVINAEKVRVTGSKEARKVYHHHTGSIGGIRETSYRMMIQRKPEYVIEHAVKGMMPKKNRLGRHQMKKLRVFRNEKHGMESQKPIVVNI
ncbi:MAG: 50S ribosomal protein L13 [Chlamydiota bacterium]